MSAFHTQLLDLVGFTSYMATFADPTRELVLVEPFSWVLDGNVLSQPITGNNTATFDLLLTDDADFVIESIAQFARQTGMSNLLVNPSILVQISDLTTGESFFSAPAPLPMVGGQGGFPFILPGPVVLKPRATLRTVATACGTITSTASFSGLYMAFHGARLWYG